jgi:alpha-D-ribose 1-methylphosphonate 5-phosphate C-P lyase
MSRRVFRADDAPAAEVFLADSTEKIAIRRAVTKALCIPAFQYEKCKIL